MGRCEIFLAEPEAAKNRGDPQVYAVAVLAAEALLELGVTDEHVVVFVFRDGGVAQLLFEGVHFRLHVEERLEGGGGLVEERAAGVIQPVLREVAHGQAGGLDDMALVGLVEAGQHLEQGGLAGAVGAAEADPFPGPDLPGDAFEQGPGAERLAEFG